jgi:predicted 3-demethylubiquinone-9 3-methyltransferase (glyoxalase superfamily)
MKNPIYPCLWFATEAKEAAQYYCGIFKNSRIIDESPIVVTFELNGNKFMALNGGTEFTFNDSVSFVVSCDNQDEIDHYWYRLTENGGEESMCGWLKDKYGVSWQIVPSNLDQLIRDPERAERVMKVVLQMRKLDMEAMNRA